MSGGLCVPVLERVLLLASISASSMLSLCELQNAVMEEGQRRFTVGEQCHWGHTRACPYCLDL